MPDELRMKILLATGAARSLWNARFVDALGHAGFSPLGDALAAVLTGQDEPLWFDRRTEAWQWLRDHDGSLTLWGPDERVVEITIRRSRSADTISFGRSLPWTRRDAEVQQRVRDIERAANLAITLGAEIERAVAVTDDLLEAIVRSGAVHLLDTNMPGSVPACVGYWNAFPLQSRHPALESIAQAGGTIEQHERHVVARLARWPWELDFRSAAALSISVFS